MVATPSQDRSYHQVLESIPKLRAKFLKSAERDGYLRFRRRWRPDMQALRRLTEEIRELPKSRRLTVGQAREWSQVVWRLYRRQQRLEMLISRALRQQAQLEYRRRLGERLAHGRDALAQVFAQVKTIEGLRRMLIHQRDGREANVHAVAMGKLSAAKRTRQDYAALGRRGAQVR